MLVMDLSPLSLRDQQLPKNLNLIQHPAPSSLSFFFFPFDFPTLQGLAWISPGANPIFASNLHTKFPYLKNTSFDHKTPQKTSVSFSFSNNINNQNLPNKEKKTQNSHEKKCTFLLQPIHNSKINNKK